MWDVGHAYKERLGSRETSLETVLYRVMFNIYAPRYTLDVLDTHQRIDLQLQHLK